MLINMFTSWKQFVCHLCCCLAAFIDAGKLLILQKFMSTRVCVCVWGGGWGGELEMLGAKAQMFNMLQT